MFKFQKRLLGYYTSQVRGNSTYSISTDHDIKYWQDQLFITFLIYCFPVSFIAVIPGVIMSIRYNNLPILITDLSCLLTLAVITFSNKLHLQTRKIFIITIFYVLAVMLIYNLGFIGPGVFYLFGITIIIALICPINYAYVSIIVNTAIFLLFALAINYLVDSPITLQYKPAQWIAFSANVVFLSIVLVALIGRILKKLHLVIGHRTKLQERYQQIFDKSPIPMWLFDVDTLKFLFINEAAIRHYGYSKEEFLAMTIKDIRSPQRVSELENIVILNKVTKQFYNGTSQHIKKNGEYLFAKIESNILELNGVIARIVLATDITEQLESEQEIYLAQRKIIESEANLQAIFESSVDGFILLNQDFRIKAFNKKAEEYIKLNKIDLKFQAGKSILDFVENSRIEPFKAILKKVYKGEIVEYDRRHRGGNDVTQWVHYTLTPVYEKLNVVGACITGRDITTAKIHLQTIELQNKKFHEISWIQSHLVRAPVARIMALSTLIIEGPNESDMAQIATYLSESASELDNIIRTITQKTFID